MFGGNTSQPPTAKPFGVQDQMTSNQQQAVPVAYIAGTRKLAVKWLTPIYNLRSAPAPARTGKK
jgi:hypothetical protein